MTKFQEAVVKIVNLIPEGKVVSYGQVALYVGLPRAAREVGWALRSLEEEVQIPWWRVINNEGRISIKGNQYADANTQKKLLEAENVAVSENFEVDIEKCRFTLSRGELKELQLEDDYIEMILKKYSQHFKTQNSLYE